MMTLEEFIKSSERNRYVKYKTISSYVRKSIRYIEGKRVYALDRANTSNTKHTHMRRGYYKEFDILMRREGQNAGFDGVYVECVLNPFLNEVLPSWGYKKTSDCPSCFWFAFHKENSQ